MFNNKFKTDSVVEAVKEIIEDGDCVTKPEAKKIAKKEVSHHNVTMHKGQKDTANEEAKGESKKDFMARQKRLAAASAETEKNPEKMKRLSKIPGYTGAMDLAKKTVNKEEITFKDKLISNLMEREMTSKEAKKKEEIVMAMKDKQDYFKKKYGKRWKEVMYATATKQAMKKEEYESEEELFQNMEQIDEKRGSSTRSDKEKEATDAAQQTLDFMKSGGKIQTEPKKTRKPRKITKSTFLGTYKPGMREENVVEEVEELEERKFRGGGRRRIVKKPGLIDIIKSKLHLNGEEFEGLEEGSSGAKYKVKIIGRDSKGDYYVSPNTGKKVYKSGVNRGDHEVPHTGEIKKKVTGEGFEMELTEGHHMHTHTVHFACPETGEWKGKMIYNADHDNEAVDMAHDMAKKQGLKVMKVSKNHVVVSDRTMGEEYELGESENLLEKNKPTDAKKWARAKSMAKSKFSVYPSAYANAWASKKYKAMGGGWRSTKEEVIWEDESLDEEESGLRMAAHAANREGKKMFSFKGKTYPVTVKKEGMDEKLDTKQKTVDMLRGRVKVPASYDNEHKSAKVKLEGKQPEQDNLPFVPDVKQPENIKDKSGAVHSPMSRARHLARMAMAKLKKEMK